MNFDSERNKPIFAVRLIQLTFANARGILDEVLSNRTAINAKEGGDAFVKAAAAKRLTNDLLLSVDEVRPDEVREWVVTRLEIDRDEKFEFLDGTTYTGGQAADEVRKGTEVGQYFLDLEKETLRIVQEAFKSGKLNAY